MCSNGSGDFEINQTKIKGGCQSGRKVVTHDSKSDLPLVSSQRRKKVQWFFIWMSTLQNFAEKNWKTN